MQLRTLTYLVTLISFIFPMQVVAAPTAPTLTYSINGLTVTASWTSVSGASEYKLSYAPDPYTGPDTIASLNIGIQTSFSATLWEGAAFFIAVQAGDEQGFSEYSNIENFTISQSTVDVTGNWAIVETLGPNNCGIDPGLDESSVSVINQTGAALTAQFSDGPLSGNLIGNTLSLSGIFQEDEFSVDYTTNLSILADGNQISGSASWTIISDNFSCSGTSSITGSRV